MHDGTHVVKYRPRLCGVYHLSVLVNGAHISGSVFPVRVWSPDDDVVPADPVLHSSSSMTLARQSLSGGTRSVALRSWIPDVDQEATAFRASWSTPLR